MGLYMVYICLWSICVLLSVDKQVGKHSKKMMLCIDGVVLQTRARINIRADIHSIHTYLYTYTKLTSHTCTHIYT